MRLRNQIVALSLTLSAGCVEAMNRLPPQDAPVHHWPWWVRILAVIGVLAFVQIVARSLRKGAGRPGAGPSNSAH